MYTQGTTSILVNKTGKDSAWLALASRGGNKAINKEMNE
jgi:hypothetical protein